MPRCSLRLRATPGARCDPACPYATRTQRRCPPLTDILKEVAGVEIPKYFGSLPGTPEEAVKAAMAATKTPEGTTAEKAAKAFLAATQAPKDGN